MHAGLRLCRPCLPQLCPADSSACLAVELVYLAGNLSQLHKVKRLQGPGTRRRAETGGGQGCLLTAVRVDAPGQPRQVVRPEEPLQAAARRTAGMSTTLASPSLSSAAADLSSPCHRCRGLLRCAPRRLYCRALDVREWANTSTTQSQARGHSLLTLYTSEKPPLPSMLSRR